jgi:hypothetical protein
MCEREGSHWRSKKMKKYLVLLIPALLASSGCVSTSATQLSAGPTLPATTLDSVTIYKSRVDIPGDYREIALLDSDGDAIYSNYGQLYASMRKKAAAMGANGILLGQTTEPDPLIKLAAFVFDGTAKRQVSATAIMVPSQPVVLAPAQHRK